MKKKYNTVLAIAGSDSGGGAGIQADIKSISACGCYASNAITAITAQNTLGVIDIHPIPINIIIKQLKAVLEDIGADSIKIGMLHNSETIIAVYETLQSYNTSNVILDPVMVSTSGHKLLENKAIKTLNEVLIPNARVITPNIPEAEILLNTTINTQNELPELAIALSKKFNDISVFLKSGHSSDNQIIDVFYNAEQDEIIKLVSQRVQTKNTHGTGCSLSSAFAAFIAKGYSLSNAAKSAKEYVNQAIIKGKDYKIGNGYGPIHHFYNYWK